jgi:hypothetical protein
MPRRNARAVNHRVVLTRECESSKTENAGCQAQSRQMLAGQWVLRTRFESSRRRKPVNHRGGLAPRETRRYEFVDGETGGEYFLQGVNRRGDFGFASGGNRRPQGANRLEIAHLAGIGISPTLNQITARYIPPAQPASELCTFGGFLRLANLDFKGPELAFTPH